MVKIKASKNEIKENFYIMGIGYCGAQYLLRPFEAVAYSSGNYGWACDYYYINNVLVSTGYSYIHNKNIKYDYDKLQKLEKKAQAIYTDYESKLTYKQKDQRVKSMLIRFIKKSIEDYKNSIA